MKHKPMFKPHPDGEQILLTLSGVLLMCVDVIYGDPAQTTPEGKANAMRIVDRTLKEAAARGFKQSDTVWALMRRNDITARLANLVRDAVALLPNEMQGRIMEEELHKAGVRPLTLPAVAALGESSRLAPETNPNLTRPGPDGVDPRFWAAGKELERIAETEGEGAVHKPEHAHLYAQMMRYAPEPLRSEMRQKAQEMGLLPKVTHVGDDGQAVFSSEQIAATHGVTVDEVHRMMEASGIQPGDLYSGSIHPLQ